MCFCFLMSSGSLNRKLQLSVKGAFEARDFFFFSFPERISFWERGKQIFFARFGFIQMQRMKSGQKHELVFTLNSSSSDPVSDQICMKDDYGHKKRKKLQEVVLFFGNINNFPH